MAVFVGTDAASVHNAPFGVVHREEHEDQAGYLRRNNAVYGRARYRINAVKQWPSGESMTTEISSLIVQLDVDGDDGNGPMRQRGPAEEVEGAKENSEEECGAWTAAMPEVDLTSIPAGGVFAVAAAKLEAAERIAARTTAAKLTALVESGHGPVSETGREELLTACKEAIST